MIVAFISTFRHLCGNVTKEQAMKFEDARELELLR